jgi:hypothetical protein
MNFLALTLPDNSRISDCRVVDAATVSQPYGFFSSLFAEQLFSKSL